MAAASSPSLSRVGTAAVVPHGATRVAAPSGSTALTLDVTLKPRSQAALDAFVKAVNTKGDAEYHHFLSKGQFAEYFGPTADTVTAVKSALQSRGLTVGAVSADNLSIQVKTTVAGASSAFGTSFDGYKLPSGRTAYANTAAPELPSTVASAITGVVGLDDLTTPTAQHSGAKSAAKTTSTGVTSNTVHAATTAPTLCTNIKDALASNGFNDTQQYYSAESLAAEYGLNGLFSAGAFGSGISVGLFELEAYDADGVSAYQSCYGTSVSVTNIPVDGGPTAPPSINNNIGVESALDIEDIIGLAPAASIKVYQGPDAASATDAQILDTYQKMVTDDSVNVISSSWGLCEPDSASATIASENTIFEQAAAQGQTVFAASGDQGSTGCDYTGATGTQKTELAVSDPASQPYVTGVGGTTLVSGSTSPTGSTVWNRSALNASQGFDVGATGGGVSQVWSLNSTSGFQSTVSGAGYSNACGAASGSTCRQVPDVSALADDVAGYMISLADSASPTQDGWYGIGGTSGATPTWAALLADVESTAGCTGATKAGWINPELYQAGNTSLAQYFSDVTSGNNDDSWGGYTGGLYTAGTGYDLATGLGQPKAAGIEGLVCGTTFTAAGPSRLLDTRQHGTLGPAGPVAAGGVISLNVYGTNGVPSGTNSPKATAVVLNVTVTATGSNGYLTVYPNGTTVSAGSSLNWTAGETIANLVTVPVGTNGEVNFKNTGAGTVQVVADLFGYYTRSSGSLYNPKTPVRILDTRDNGQLGPAGPVAGGGTITRQIAGLTVNKTVVVPADATAVVMNVTVTGTKSNGYLTVYPGNETTLPIGSNVNWTAGETLPNLVTVPIDSSGNIQFHNTGTGSVHIVADLEGYYAPTGFKFTALGPKRILDTRPTAVAPGGSVTLKVAGANSIPAGVTAVVLNVTVTGPTGNGYLTVYPDGVTMPTASNVNWTPGETIPNAVLVQVGSDGKVVFHNTGGGTVQVVADAFGYFD